MNSGVIENHQAFYVIDDLAWRDVPTVTKEIMEEISLGYVRLAYVGIAYSQ